MEEARKLRLKAERYRDFAALACDGRTREARFCRARHYERLADELDGRQPPLSAPAGPVTPLETLRRAIAKLAAVAS
jgi:hypothetical protein